MSTLPYRNTSMNTREAGHSEEDGERAFVAEVEEAETIAEVVVRTVAAVTGEHPIEMQPLGGVLDADALNRVFGGEAIDGRLSFRYRGCRVTVRDGGSRVRVRPEAYPPSTV